MFYDKFGQAAVSFGYRWKELEPYIVEEVGDVTYICYTDDDQRAVKRITQEVDEGSGVITTTTEIGFGAWADRADLNYGPINKEIVR